LRDDQKTSDTCLSWISIAAGTLTVVPTLSGPGAVFNLAQIVWFLALGMVLLRGQQPGHGVPHGQF